MQNTPAPPLAALTTYLGIDIAKKTLDLCLRRPDGSTRHFSLANRADAFCAFLAAHQLLGPTSVVAMENTGRYNWALYQALATLGPAFQGVVYVLCPLSLNKSLGLVRGKNDRIDARRIAEYACLHAARLRPWQPASADLQELAALLALRKRRVRAVVALKNSAPAPGEQQTLASAELMSDWDAALLDTLKKQLTAIEAQLERLVTTSHELAPLYQVLRTVPGAGKVICWKLLEKTRGFTQLTNPRQLACYAGVVPFDNQSGSSLRGRSKVSFLADKELKKLLHLGAMSAIQRKNSELKAYYERKVGEGKSKMSVLNAVRNKIVHRLCAVAKTLKPYQDHQPQLQMS